jgi:uracil-DNA glycosylase family 4
MALAKPDSCKGCPLYNIGYGWSVPDGKGTVKLLITGEALGSSEAADGLPFRPYAQSGAILEKALRNVGLTREMFKLWNIIGCQPPKNELLGAPWEFGAINHCQQHFDRLADSFKPNAILALGGIPVRTLTGLTGKKLGITNIRGFAIPSLKRPWVPVVGSYHPSFIARGKASYLGVLMHDIVLAYEIAKGGTLNPPKPNFHMNPSESMFRDELEFAKANPNLHIFHDCETMETLESLDESEFPEHFQQITQVQWGIGPDRPAQVMVYADKFIEFFKAIMSTSNPKVAWNGWKFDRKRYQEHQIPFSGTDHDAMALWHHWQPDLPRGLQYSCSFIPALYGIQPWKHESKRDPGFYGWCDIEYMRKNFYDTLRKVKSKGMEGSYSNLVIDFQNVVLTPMGERGIPVHNERRLALGEKLTQSCLSFQSEAQSLVTDAIKPVKQKSGLVREPEDKTGMVQREFLVEKPTLRPCTICNGIGNFPELIPCICTDHSTLPFDPDCNICSGTGKCPKLKCTKGETVTVTKKCINCKGKGVVKTGEVYKVKEIRWAKLEEFNLASGDQVIDAIRAAGLEPPRNFEDQDKDTLGKKELERFLKKVKNPSLKRLLELRLEYQTNNKLKGAYVEGWEPDVKTGAVHAEYGQWTGTGQLTANNPNTMTLPKRGVLADEFRGLIYAPTNPEKLVIVERDYAAAHALTLGHLAKSPLYMNLARNDIHGFMTLHAMHKPEADKSVELARLGTKESLAELKSIISYYRSKDEEFEKARNFKSKPAILGIGFMMGVKKLYNENREGFKNLAEAELFWKIPRKLAPEVFTFQTNICKLARQGYLISDFKFIRWFWDVWKYDPKLNASVLSEGAEDAVAFLPANHAFGIMREALLKMHYEGDYLNKFSLRNIVHDAVWFFPRWKDVEECLHISKVYMEAPNTNLINEVTPEGLYIGTEATVGMDLRKGKLDSIGKYKWGMIDEHNLPLILESIEPKQSKGELVYALS